MKVKKKDVWIIAGICCACLFLLYLAIYFWPSVSGFVSGLITASLALIIGGIIAYILNILMSFYERIYFKKSQKPFVNKSRRPVCMIAAILTFLALIALIVALVVPEFIACIKLLIEKIPGAVMDTVEKLEEWGILTHDVVEQIVNIDWQSRLEQIVGVVTSGIGSVVDIAINLATSVISIAITSLLAFIFAIYVLSSKDKLKRQGHSVLKTYCKESVVKRVEYVLHVFDESFHNYIVGQCTEALIIGVLCTAGMLILKLPYATMIGALIAFTALVPIAGAWIGAGVGAFMILTVSPMKALIFLIFILVLQQFEGNVIYPRVVGSSIGLPGIWVLVAVTVGGGIGGVMGMLFAVPVLATIYKLVANDIRKRDKDKKKAVKTELAETTEQ